MKTKFSLSVSQDEAAGCKKLSIKSCCFHSSRSFVFCGLSNGEVRCYDYLSSGPGSGLVGEFRHHTGPVRSVSCHPQPQHSLLASGGDDTDIVLWDTKGIEATNKKRGRLRGHTDYVRDLAWHQLYPWILSASDDCTVKVWNWLNRSLVTSITGHQHWVTSLALHTTRDVFMSASVDGTVRVWDYSALRNRTCRTGAHTEVASLLGMVDVVCQKILDDFSEQLIFLRLHPTREVLAVGEGRHVTLYSTETWREVGRLVGHRDRLARGGLWRLASSGSYDLFLSLGRDRTVRVWSQDSGVCRWSHHTDQTYEGLAGSERLSYLACWGADTLALLKVEAERPVMVSYAQHLYFLKNGTVRHYNCEKQKERVLFTVCLPRDHELSSMDYNPSEHSLLLNSVNKRAGRQVYQLYPVIDGVSNGKLRVSPSPGSCSLWTSHSRFAHLDEKHQIIVKNLQDKNVNFGGLTAGFLLPKSQITANTYKQPGCDRLLPGGDTNCVILQSGDTLTLYDVTKKRRLHSAHFPGVKRLLWSSDRTLVALCCRREVIICDKKLKALTSSKTRCSLKSVAWYSERKILLYSTETQVRFLLPAGYEGAVLTTREILYIGVCRGEDLVCVNRRQQIRKLEINPAEFLFKAAVLENNEQDILRLISSGKIIGQSQLQFLREVCRPELALGFIKDPMSRCQLALESNNLAVAFAAASDLDDGDTWLRLGELSLLHGKLELAEQSYQRGRHYDKLIFLYVITGQREKLVKLGRIFKVRGEVSSLVEVGLVVRDGDTIADSLALAGHKELAVLARANIQPSVLSPSHYSQSTTDWPESPQKFRGLKGSERREERYRDDLRDSLVNSCDT